MFQLLCLFLHTEISRKNIPSFSTLVLDGTSQETPFANSLTLTNNDFANYMHMDNDHIAIAYGMWWKSKVQEVIHNEIQYTFDKDVDHECVKGGRFVWGEYGIGVEFEK
jgi:hypothetical protein